MAGWSTPERTTGGVGAFPLITPLTLVSEETGGASKSMCNKVHNSQNPTKQAEDLFIICIFSAAFVSLGSVTDAPVL